MPLPLLLNKSFSSLPKIAHSPNKRPVHTEPPTLFKEDQAVVHITQRSFSIFDTLPVELQVEIFLHCLPPFPTFNPDEAPLVLAQVCHSWNILALNTPRLWSSFTINIKGSGHFALAWDMQLMDNVKRWLQRSNPYPLSFQLKHIAGSADNDSHRSGQILALLITNSHRWKHVDFVIPSGNAYVLQSIRSRHLPALKSLSLRTHGSLGSKGFLQFSLAHVPWKQISTVNLQLDQTLINIDQCLQMLRQAKRLQECNLDVDCTMSQCDLVPEPIVLPSLKTFRLTFRQGSAHATADLCRFLNAIQTPRLRTMYLIWSIPSRHSTPSNYSDMYSFFEKISKTLRQLTIAYLPLSDHVLQTLLHQLPNVTHLTLKYPLNDPNQDPITNSFFSAGTLTAPPSGVFHDQNEPLLPKMKHCNIECHGQAYTSAALIAFLRSRTVTAICQNSDGGLSSASHSVVMKSFRLFSMKAVPEGVQSLTRQWRDDGLNISIEGLYVR